MKKQLFVLLPAVLLLGACTAHSDLRTWMEQEKQQAKSNLKQPEQFDPPAYIAYNPAPFSGLNAFNPQRLKMGQEVARGENAPDPNRKKELLEGYGLDKLQYVGSLNRRGEWLALIQVDNRIYTVKNGNYLGTDYGRVTNITPDKVTLEETIQDTEGEWVHRTAEITLASK